jgi:hypothetical protein
MTTNSETQPVTLDTLYDLLEQNSSEDEMPQKVKFLKNYKSPNNFAIGQYPSGTPLKILEKIGRYLKTFPAVNFQNLSCFATDPNHHCFFIMVRLGTSIHEKCEKLKAKTGGINSTDISRQGTYTLVKVDEEKNVVDEALFNFYRLGDEYWADFAGLVN